MTSPILNFLQQAELPGYFYEILKLVIPALVGVTSTYYTMRSQSKRLQTDITIDNSKQGILERQDRGYWMQRCEEALEESLEVERKFADSEIFKRGAVRVFKKLRRLLPDIEGVDPGLLDDIDELLLEAE